MLRIATKKNTFLALEYDLEYPPPFKGRGWGDRRSGWGD